MAKRKVFHSVIRRKGVVGVAEQDGFEIEIDGEIFNAYANENVDRAYIIDPQTGLALYIYDYEYDGEEFRTEIKMVKRARKKLIEDKEHLEKWREGKSKESYKLAVETFDAYKKAEKLREKQKEAARQELRRS